MTSWTTPATWSGATLTAAQLNEQLRDDTLNIEERLALHGIRSATTLARVGSAVVGARATASTYQTVSANTDTTLLWDTEAWDTDGFHDTATNTGRLTIPSGLGGRYLVWAAIGWTSNFTGNTWLWVEDDGGVIEGRTIEQAPSNDTHRVSLCFVTRALAAGDWLVARVRHNASGSMLADRDETWAGFTAIRLFAT